MNAPDNLPGVVDASTFEARYTAWVDGQLSATEAAAFERELREQHSLDAATEREAAETLRGVLREHLTPAPLANADFFNHQLLERIEADRRANQPRPTRSAEAELPWIRSIFARLAMTGATLLFVGAVGYRAFIVPTMEQRPETAYLTRVVDAKSNTPGISAVPLEYNEEGVTVLWLDGMDHLPEAFAQAEEPIEGETTN